jgi:hypothetical protein
MPKYCTHVVGDDGRVEKSRSFICETDADALVWAKHLMEGHMVELWSGDRLVDYLLPPAPPKAQDAVTHVIVDGRMIPKAGK